MASKTIEKDKTFSDAEGKLYNYNSMKIELNSLKNRFRIFRDRLQGMQSY